MKKLSQEDFIKKAREVHGNKFDYSKSVYKTNKFPITIICPEHGEFETTPVVHLKGFNCPHCRYGGNSEERGLQFIAKAKQVHFDRNYDYSLVDYKNNTTKVKIICPEHGEFEQNPGNHLNGQKCPVCAKQEGDLKQRFDIEELIKKLNIIHNNKYQYQIEGYLNIFSKIRIICPEHGEFEQAVGNHLNGQGCRKCGINNTKLTKEQFIQQSKKIHGDKYDYSKVEFENTKSKIVIGCPKHGDFEQQLSSHTVLKAGCPKCATTCSKFEQWVSEVIELASGEKPVKYKMQDKKQIDVLYKNVGFEANGLFYHTEKNFYGGDGKNRNYHLNKTLQAAREGIKLYHIFEDEYYKKEEIVKHKILNACGLNDGIKANARDCQINYLDFNTSQQFLNKFHIQGADIVSIRFGAYIGDELVGVMTFKDKKDGIYELNRYATNYNYHVRGLASKILQHFIKIYKPSKITTFADIRWTPDGESNLYTKLGFKLVKKLPPTHHYYNKELGAKRFNRIQFQKHKLLKKFQRDDRISSEMSESKIMELLGYDRIWDCGNWKYEINF